MSAATAPPAAATAASASASAASTTTTATAAEPGLPALLVYVCQFLVDHGLRLEKTSAQPAAELQAMLAAHIDKREYVASVPACSAASSERLVNAAADLRSSRVEDLGRITRSQRPGVRMTEA